jgi:peptidoglycan/xylan/chitin deacetylase (PgdA/CDA1 family)
MNKYIDYIKIKISERYHSYLRHFACILMLHRVVEDYEASPVFTKGNHISKSYLKWFIERSISNNICFISIDELINMKIQDIDITKKYFVITIDDGYKDTYENAVPLFEEYRIPFTLYISNSFPNQTALLWWYIIEDLIKSSDSITFNNGKCCFEIDTFLKKERVFKYISRYILDKGAHIENEFCDIFGVNTKTIDEYREYCIDWRELNQMLACEDCTIGSHTFRHFGLRAESEDVILDDIRLSIFELEKKTKCNIKHFAYPYGSIYSVGERERRIVKETNLTSAVSAIPELIDLKNINDRLYLPRIPLLQGCGPGKYL